MSAPPAEIHLTTAELAQVIEHAFWDLCEPPEQPPAYPGGGGRARWSGQFQNCATRALAAGKACRAEGVSGEKLETALAVAIFIGFFEPRADWYCLNPPRGFDALPREQQDAFRFLARATIAYARTRRRAA